MPFIDILTMVLETIGTTLIATLFAYVLGLPFGVLLNVTKKTGLKPCGWISTIAGVVVNILRSIPCLIVIVLCIPVTRAIFERGTGEWYTILIPLTICAFGFVARMVEQSLAEVSTGKIEAAKALGATNYQIVTKVLLPEARASLVTGVAVVAVSVLGYTSFAYNIGAGGLISGIYTYYTRHTGDYMKSILFWVLIVLTVLIVQGIQELGLFVAKKIDKRKVAK